MQLDAIRSLWRQIQKLQTGKRDGVGTPSTPMTPLTPLTPLDTKEKGDKGIVSAKGVNARTYSEESVKELTLFCTSLQNEVRSFYLFCILKFHIILEKSLQYF